MTPEQVELIESTVVYLAAFVAIVAIISTLYIVNIYRQRHQEALFLTRLVVRDVRVGVCAAVILIYLALALSDRGLGRPWGAIVIGIPVIVMLYGPTSDAMLWWRERRRGK